MKTTLLHIPLFDASKALDVRIAELCEVQHAAGMHLISTFIISTDLFLLFQTE